MRVPRVHLRDERPRHILHGKRAALFGHHGVKEYLQQQVAQFVTQHRIVTAGDGIVDFVRLLDEVRPQRGVRLNPIPVAAHSEILHNRQRVVERARGGSSGQGTALGSQHVHRCAGCVGTLRIAV